MEMTRGKTRALDWAKSGKVFFRKDDVECFSFFRNEKGLWIREDCYLKERPRYDCSGNLGSTLDESDLMGLELCKDAPRRLQVAHHRILNEGLSTGEDYALLAWRIEAEKPYFS